MERPAELEDCLIVDYMNAYEIFTQGATLPKKRKEEYGVFEKRDDHFENVDDHFENVAQDR